MNEEAKYDETKVYTALNAHKVKAGSRGYFADNLKTLKEAVEHRRSRDYGTVEKILDEDNSCRFSMKDVCGFALFYLSDDL